MDAGGGFDKQRLLVAGLGVMAAIFLIFGYTSAWSSWTIDGGGGPFMPEGEVTVGWELNGVESSFGGTSQSEDYGSGEENVESLFDWTLAILILATVLLLAGVGLAVAGLLGLDVPFTAPKQVALVLAIAGLVTLAAPLQVMIGFPGAIEDDGSGDGQGDDPGDSFWGENGGLSWGAGWAWYATLIAGIASIGAAAPAFVTGGFTLPELSARDREREPARATPEEPPEPTPERASARADPPDRPTGEVAKPPAWAMLLPAITLVLAVAAIFGTWHAWDETEVDQDGNVTDANTYAFGLDSLTVEGDGGGSVELAYTGEDGGFGQGPSLDEVESTFDWTLVLVVLTALFAAGAGTLFVMRAFELGALDLHSGVPRVVAAVAALLALGTCVQVLLGFPAAVGDAGFDQVLPCEDVDDTPADAFWGTCTGSEGEATWGASWSWFLMLAGSLTGGVAAAVPWQGAEQGGVRSVRVEDEAGREELLLEVDMDETEAPR